MKVKIICDKCKGSNVETKAWIDPNDNIILDTCFDGNIEDSWCRDCNEHVSLETITIKEDDLQLKLEL